MKRLFAILAAIVIMSGITAIHAESAVGAALDAAFEAGTLAMGKAAFEKPDPATCRIVVPPEEAWGIIQGIPPEKPEKAQATPKPASSVSSELPGRTSNSAKKPEPTPAPETIPMDESTIRELLAQGDIVIRSFSPDGRHAVGFLNGIPVAVSEDTLAVVYPSKTRGAEDSYGLKEEFYFRCWQSDRKDYPLGIGKNGMKWSPDGRYCCAINGDIIRRETQVNMGASAVVDTLTGEMFLLDTYNKNILKEDGGCLTDGFFSPDGEYFYGVFCGKKYTSPDSASSYVLIRYRLETCEAEKIMDLDYDAKSCAMMPDRRILLLSCRNRKDDLLELAVIRDGVYEERQPVPFMEQSGRFTLAVSPVSGEAILLMIQDAGERAGVASEFMNEPGIAFSVMSPVSMEKGLAESLNTVWMIRGRIYNPRLEGADAGCLLNTKSAMEYLLPPGGSFRDFYTGDAEQPWTIWETEVSPDGRYAAVLSSVNRQDTLDMKGKVLLFMVRLSDMKMLQVAGFIRELDEVSIELSKLSLYRNTLEWSEAGLLIDIIAPELWQII